MRRTEIILYGRNEDYIFRLQNTLNERHLLPFPVCGFTEYQRLVEYRQRGEVKLLIVDEENLEDVEDWTEETKNLTLLILTNGREKGQIFRYQSVEMIAKEVMDLTGMDTAVSLKKDGRGELIGIYSPVGRSLKTSFTLCLGQMLSRKYRVLYLNFESYSGFGELLRREQSTDMADLLFYLRNIKGQFPNQVRETRQSINGMDFIPPALSFMDLSEVTPPEWDEFFDELFSLKEYDYILLDLSDYLQGLFDILKRCSRIYTMTKNDRVAQAKLAQYEKLLEELRLNEIIDKTKKCYLPVCRELPFSVEDLVYSKLGDAVRQVAREDFKW